MNRSKAWLGYLAIVIMTVALAAAALAYWER